MPRKGDERETQKVKTQAKVHAAPVESPAPAEPPVPDVEAPPTPGEMERRRVDVEKLEEMGRSPESSPTQQLVQMAAEAGPSTSGREELVRRKPQLTMGGKAPQKEFLQAGKVKKPQRYQLGIMALCEISRFQQGTGLIHNLPFSCLVCEISLEVG